MSWPPHTSKTPKTKVEIKNFFMMCPVLSDHAYQEWSLNVKTLPSFLLSITGFALSFNLGGIPIQAQIEQILVMSGRDYLPIMSSLYHMVRIGYQNDTGSSRYLRCYLPKFSLIINSKINLPPLLGNFSNIFNRHAPILVQQSHFFA